MSDPILFLLIFFITYLIGAIPTSYWFCRLVGGIDVTRHGSGNSGASNAARVMGRHYFVPIALIDATKAYAALALGAWLLPMWVTWASVTVYVPYLLVFMLLLGNAYSPFLGFRGGKGVATSVGILWHSVAWPISVAFMLSWLSLVGLTKRPFLASLGALAIAWAVAFMIDITACRVLLLMLTGWMLLRHRGNIRATL